VIPDVEATVSLVDSDASEAAATHSACSGSPVVEVVLQAPSIISAVAVLLAAATHSACSGSPVVAVVLQAVAGAALVVIAVVLLGESATKVVVVVVILVLVGFDAA
jgi:hypothetical protein